MTLVLEFKKVESDDETKYSTFYSSSKAKRTINKSDINDVLNQSIVRIHQTYKTLLVVVRVGLIQSIK